MVAKTHFRVEYKQFYESNSFGTMEVIDRKTKKLKVRFLNTGYEAWADPGNVLAGKVKDHSVVYEQPEIELNELCDTNSSGKCLILSRKGKSCVVQFLDTGFTKTANVDNVRVGKIRDPYAKTFLNIGYLGEFKKTNFHKRALQLWSNMLKRCYNPNDERGYFGMGVTVDDRWHCFANFIEDLPTIQNFDLWLKGYERGTKYNLDKDLKFEGNKVYSREACMFVTESENKAAGAKNKLGKK